VICSNRDPNNLRQRRVLIVNDDRDTIDRLALFLERGGAIVESASTARGGSLSVFTERDPYAMLPPSKY